MSFPTNECCLTGLDCVLADPCHVATQGLLDNTLGVATLGWIVEVPAETPVVVTPVDPVGSMVGDPRREWWVRKDDTDEWFGPLSYRDANSQARRMTLPTDINAAGNSNNIKYAQVGTIMGTRGGDPNVPPDMMVVFMYANGKQTLGGRMAEYHKDKWPVS